MTEKAVSPAEAAFFALYSVSDRFYKKITTFAMS
jgi:hypothetical protein